MSENEQNERRARRAKRTPEEQERRGRIIRAVRERRETPAENGSPDSNAQSQETVEGTALSPEEREAVQERGGGLAITARLTASTRSLAVGSRDSEVPLLQTAEEAQGTIANILQRMRGLALQANNGSNSENDTANLNGEFEALRNEIDHVAANASFNGISLLNGERTTVALNISNVSSMNPLLETEDGDRIRVWGDLQSRNYDAEKEAAPELKGLRKIRG